jgi:hypothetical protein
MGVPVWQTPEGFLGTATERTTTTFALSVVNPATFSLISGHLPTGLQLSTNGIISGFPASVGETTRTQFVVRATDADGITDRTFIIDTQGLSNLAWVTPSGYLNVGFGDEEYVINKEYVNFQFTANPGQILTSLSDFANVQVNTLYLSTLTNVDMGQPGIWRAVGGYGIQQGTTITSISTIFNPVYNGFATGISLPTTAALSTGSYITLYDSLPPGEKIRYYIEDQDGYLPPGLTLSVDGQLTGYVFDNLGLDYQVSTTGGYDTEKYDGYPYDHSLIVNGQYVQQIVNFIPKIYQFRITATDGVTSVKRAFKILVVDPSNLSSDINRSDASGPLAAESSYLIKPIWLGTPGAGATSTASTPLDSISVSPLVTSLFTGQTAQLSVTAHYADGNSFDVTSNALYSSSNPSSAPVSSQGLVTGLSAGGASITVTFGGFTITRPLTVTQGILTVFNSTLTTLSSFVASGGGTYTQTYLDPVAATTHPGAYIVVIGPNEAYSPGIPVRDPVSATYGNCIGQGRALVARGQGVSTSTFNYVCIVPLAGYNGLSTTLTINLTGPYSGNSLMATYGAAVMVVYNVNLLANTSTAAILSGAFLNDGSAIPSSQPPIPTTFSGLNPNDLVISFGNQNTTGGNVSHQAIANSVTVNVPPGGSYGSTPNGNMGASYVFNTSNTSTITYYWQNPFWTGQLFNQYTNVMGGGLIIRA